MKRPLALAALLLVRLAAGSLAEGSTPVRIVIIGDSTVCDYPATNATRGWGQFVEERFRPGTVRVVNLARSGRSTKTFLREGLWDRALQEKPDFILIQFGHNDSHGAGKPESTKASTDFKENLRRYVAESRAAGATPILVTPMHRRTFAQGQLTDILQPYANAMKEVAADRHVGLIDLHGASGKLFTQLGEAGCAAFDNKPGDHTHFNQKGARSMADLVMQSLPDVIPRLKPLLR
jgi:lysophospholipase L1-like esterase